MSSKKSLNVREIIHRLKKVFNVQTDTELANILGIRPNTLSTWKKRESIDIELIISKCENVNLDWLLTGEGEMFRNDRTSMIAKGIGINQIKGDNNNTGNIIVNSTKQTKDIDPKIQEIIQLLQEGYYTPKLIDNFLEKLRKIKELTG